MPQGFRDAPFNFEDVPPIILAGGGVDSSVDTSFDKELPVPVPWPEHQDEEGFDEPLEETLASLPKEEYGSPLMLIPIEEELCHPRSASQRVVDTLKRSSLLPTVVSQGSWSYGEIFWEASRLADDLEKSLHDGKSEECVTLAGEYICSTLF